MTNQLSVSFKPIVSDTRNNWVTMVFVTKCRYNCFLKQSHIDTCTSAIREFESLGFEFDEFGFGGNHVHFQVNLPKRYSMQVAQTMLKSRSSHCMFEAHPGFHKRYPRCSFWSGYEHHQSTGLIDKNASTAYLRNQARHHGIVVIDDRQHRLGIYTADRDTAIPQGVAE